MGNLGIVQVTAAQNNKETTINDADNKLDLALTDFQAILVDNTNSYSLSATEWTENMLFIVQNDTIVPTGPITLTVPATIRSLFGVQNTTAFPVTVTAASQVITAPVVAPGSTQILSYDGTDVRPLSGSTVSSGNGSSNTVIAGFIPPGFRGARATLSADITGQNLTGSLNVINFDQTTYDTDNIHNPVTNNNRLTAPAGAVRVRLNTNITIANAATGGGMVIIIRNQSGTIVAGHEAQMSDFSVERFYCSTGVINVSPGDWFEVAIQISGDTSVDINTESNFTLEVVEDSDSAALTTQVVTLPARFIGATVSNAADLTAQNFSAGAVVTWDTDDIDTDDFHNTSTNTERLVIPNGVNKVRLNANVRLNNILTGDDWSVRIRKNGTDFPGGAEVAGTSAATVVEASIVSPVVSVAAGDFFDVFVDTETDTSVDVDALGSSFSIEVVERAGAEAPPTAYLAQKVSHRGATVKSNTAQSITAATDNAVEFDTAVMDTEFQPRDTGEEQRFWLGADQTFVDANVSVGSDQITLTGHGFTTGEGPVRLTNSGGALPTGLSTGTDYWIIVIDANTIQLATSRANAIAGTQVDITAAAGGGTHTVETETWIVIPAGVTKVRFNGHVALSGSTGDAILSLHKNGAIVDGGFQVDNANTTDADELSAASAVLEVSEGDRFELIVNPASGTVTLDNAVLDTYLSVEVIDTSIQAEFPGVTVNPPLRGALATRVAAQTGANYTAGVVVPFDSEVYDTDGFHDNVTNNSRLTIPANSGITRVRLKFSVVVTSHSVNDFIRVVMIKNGVVANFVGGGAIGMEGSNTGVAYLTSTSAAIDVVEGDFFEVWLDTESDTSIDVFQTSWFSIEVIEDGEVAAPPHQIEVYLDTADWNAAAFPTSAPVYKMVACRRFSLHDNLANSQGQADNGPNGGAVVIDVQRNGSSIGSITFADSTGAAQTATFSTSGSGQENFEIGDRLELVAPASWQSMDEVVISLFAFRT